MTRFVIVVSILTLLFVSACGPSHQQLLKAAYDRGEISASEYYQLSAQLEAQRRQNAAIMGMALMGYSAQMQANSAMIQANQALPAPVPPTMQWFRPYR